MKRIIVFFTLVLLAGGGYFYISSPSYPDIRGVSYTLIDGNRIDMQQLNGKPVLVTFWATTCVNCIKEIPDLIKLYHDYSAKGLEIIAVAMPYDRPDHVLEFAQARKLPYRIALDIDTRLVRAFGNVRVTPNNFLISPEGKIIKQHIGILDIQETEKWLLSL